MKPRSPADTGADATTGQIIEAMPPEMDLLLPGSAEGSADLIGMPELFVVPVRLLAPHH
jgi:hypothetical protein